jgi:hypothetical protein
MSNPPEGLAPAESPSSTPGLAPSAPSAQLPAQWTPEIDTEIVSFLEKKKKEKGLKRYTFVNAIWTELGQNLASKGHPGYTMVDLKARFTTVCILFILL